MEIAENPEQSKHCTQFIYQKILLMRNSFLLTFILSLLLYGSTSTLFAQTQSVAIEGVGAAYALAEKDGLIYVSGRTANAVYRFDPTATMPMLETVATLPINDANDPFGLAFYGDVLYIGTRENGIHKIDLSSSMPMLEQVIPHPGGTRIIGMTVAGDELFYAPQTLGRIDKIDLTAATPSPVTVVSGLSGPAGLAVRGNQMYITETNANRVSSFNYLEANPTVTPVASVPGQPVGLSIDGSLLFTAVVGGLRQVNLNDAMPTSTSVPGVSLSDPWGTVVYQGILYITNDNRVYKVEGLLPTFSLPVTCANEDMVTLGGASPTGGVYSGPGVTDNGNGEDFTFDVAGQGTGSFTVTYTIGSSMASSTLEVVAAPTVTFSTGGLSVQVDAGVQTGLSGGMPAGGVYSGNGVTDDGNGMTYSFDPAAAGEGENVITYTYSDANGCGGEQGAIITVTALAVPGDLCDEAIDISAQFGQAFNEPQTTGLFDNTMFTTGADDPAAGFDCFYGGDALQNSGWFSFTGDGNTYQVRNVQCTGPNADLDLQAVAYSGTCGNLTTVACNDDNPAGGTLTFLLEFDTQEGVEYLILVDGYDGTVGEFCIEVTNLTDPLLPGEMCTNPIDISALIGQAEMVPQVSDTYDNAEYNTDDTDLLPSCFFQLQDGTATMYYAFTGDGNRYTINSINNSNLDAPLAGVLFTGTCGMLTEVACAYQGGVANFGIDIETEAGVDYLLMVTEDFPELSNTFNLEFTNQGTTGVTDIANTALRVFPNPTNGLVQLPQIDMERVEAYDATGRLVVSQQQPGTSIDLGAQPAGLYILKMYAGQEVYSAKVVKE